MKKSKLLFILLTTTLLSACEKDILSNGETTLGKNDMIPENFDWKMTSDIDCEISVSEETTSSLKQVIKIYNSPLLTTETLIAIGAADRNASFKTTLVIPKIITTLYVEMIRPNGNRIVKEVPVVNGPIRLTLGTTLTLKTKRSAENNIPQINIPTQYDLVIKDNNPINIQGYNPGESQTINLYKSYLIPAGVQYNGEMTFNRNKSQAILYVAGTLDLGNTNLDHTSIVILNGGKVKTKNLSTGGAVTGTTTLYIQPQGNLTVQGAANISNSQKIINTGTFNLSGSLDINNQSSLQNYGSINIPLEKKQSLKITNNAQLSNYGAIEAGEIEINSRTRWLNASGGTTNCNTLTITNSGAVLDNDGKITAQQEINLTAGATFNVNCQAITATMTTSGSYLNIGEGALLRCSTFDPSGTSKIEMAESSLFICKKIEGAYGLNFSSLTDKNTRNAIVICQESLPNMQWVSGPVFTGNIEVMYGNLSNANKELYPNNRFTNGAYLVQEQKTSIEKTTCNNGEGSINNEKDSDGDGLADDLDQFPNDPNKAFITYFPSEKTWGTFAFEDLWPATGDYDMNDLVLSFQLVWISNANNLIVEMSFRSKLMAYGSAKDLAPAFQIDGIYPNQIESVSGNSLTSNLFSTSKGLESGQEYAVIPIFDTYTKVIKQLQGGAFGNTRSDGGRFEGDTLDIAIKFSSPISPIALNPGKINAFITMQGDRGREIHLPTYKPTSKAIPVESNNLSKTDMYKNKQGWMWALMFPSQFNYPYEKTNISEAYNFFQNWATSGQLNNKDWYQNKSGYRNDDKLYR